MLATLLVHVGGYFHLWAPTGRMVDRLRVGPDSMYSGGVDVSGAG